MKVLKWLDRHLEESILMVLLSSIVVVMLYQIVRRYILNSSLSWSEEFCRYCFIWFMYVAFSYSIRLKTDLRVDGVVNMLPSKLRNIVDFIGLIISGAITAYLFANSFTTVSNVIKTKEVSVGLGLPMKYVYASTVFGFGMGTIRYIQRIILGFREMRNPEKKGGETK